MRALASQGGKGLRERVEIDADRGETERKTNNSDIAEPERKQGVGSLDGEFLVKPGGREDVAADQGG